MNENTEQIVLNDHERVTIVGAVNFNHQGEAKTRWTTIGTAFQNKDGSFNLRFEYMPVTGATVQLRPFKKRDRTTANSRSAKAGGLRLARNTARVYNEIDAGDALSFGIVPCRRRGVGAAKRSYPLFSGLVKTPLDPTVLLFLSAGRYLSSVDL